MAVIDRALFEAGLPAAAEILASDDRDAVRAVGAFLAALAADGATKDVARRHMLAAPRGGDHGRAEAIRRARIDLRWIADRMPQGHAYTTASRIRAIISDYFRKEYEIVEREKIIQSDDVKRRIHGMIKSGAVVRKGGVVSSAWIADRLREIK